MPARALSLLHNLLAPHGGQLHRFLFPQLHGGEPRRAPYEPVFLAGQWIAKKVRNFYSIKKQGLLVLVIVIIVVTVRLFLLVLVLVLIVIVGIFNPSVHGLGSNIPLTRQPFHILQIVVNSSKHNVIGNANASRSYQSLLLQPDQIGQVRVLVVINEQVVNLRQSRYYHRYAAILMFVMMGIQQAARSSRACRLSDPGLILPYAIGDGIGCSIVSVEHVDFDGDVDQGDHIIELSKLEQLAGY
mmetsp:Transcript_11649/g.25250  ORF Transcript_11649/g.25250 Transcript_11649/m.25250 type:complete len:243 (+) Transcript_11649:98-826(+)